MGVSQRSGPGAATFKLHGNQFWEENIARRRCHKCDMVDLAFVGFGVESLLETVVSSAYQSLVKSHYIFSQPILVASQV